MQAAAQIFMLLQQLVDQGRLVAEEASGQGKEDLFFARQVMAEMVSEELDDPIPLGFGSGRPLGAGRFGAALAQSLGDDQSVVMVVREGNQPGVPLQVVLPCGIYVLRGKASDCELH